MQSNGPPMLRPHNATPDTNNPWRLIPPLEADAPRMLTVPQMPLEVLIAPSVVKPAKRHLCLYL